MAEKSKLLDNFQQKFTPNKKKILSNNHTATVSIWKDEQADMNLYMVLFIFRNKNAINLVPFLELFLTMYGTEVAIHTICFNITSLHLFHRVY